MITTSRTAVLPALLAVALLCAGCGSGGAGGGEAGGGGGPAASSSAAGAAPPSSSAEPDGTPAATSSDGGAVGPEDDGAAGAPPFPATTEPDTAEPSAGNLVGVTEIRLGRHDGFDRVVLEVGGAGRPGWDVRYVDVPSSQGSGAEVAVDGRAVLQATLTGTGYPADTGVAEWAGPDPLRARDTEVVTEVVWDGTFEGTSVAFVGTTARAPFRVYLLQEPVRVVIEVADPG